jgi:hypothetical protein
MSTNRRRSKTTTNKVSRVFNQIAKLTPEERGKLLFKLLCRPDVVAPSGFTIDHLFGPDFLCFPALDYQNRNRTGLSR